MGKTSYLKVPLGLEQRIAFARSTCHRLENVRNSGFDDGLVGHPTERAGFVSPEFHGGRVWTRALLAVPALPAIVRCPRSPAEPYCNLQECLSHGIIPA